MKQGGQDIAAIARYLSRIRVVVTARFAFSALAASVGLFVLVFVVFRLIGVDGPRAATYLRSVNDRRSEQALVVEIQRVGGHDCGTQPVSVSSHDFWLVFVRAVAHASCQVGSSGASRVSGYSFRSRSDLEDWNTAQSEYASSIGAYGPCEGDFGVSEWSDGSDRIRGKIACYTDPDGSAVIAWSDNDANAGYIASSTRTGLGSLFDWWQQHVRGAEVGKDSAVLSHDFGSEIAGGLHNCRQGRSPLADDVLTCDEIHAANDPSAIADSLSLYHFATEAQLNSFYSAYTNAFRAPERNAEGVACGKAELVATTYGEPTEGRVFCFTAVAGEYGASWLLWTRDHDLEAGLLERSDQNERALYRIWSDIYWCCNS